MLSSDFLYFKFAYLIFVYVFFCCNFSLAYLEVQVIHALARRLDGLTDRQVDPLAALKHL